MLNSMVIKGAVCAAILIPVLFVLLESTGYCNNQVHPAFISESNNTKARPHSVTDFQPQPVPIFLSYKSGGGLCNQLYCHLPALAIAYSLNASLVMPKASSRGSFLHSKTAWTKEPIDTLFNMEAMTRYWRQKGVSIVESLNSTGALRIDISTPPFSRPPGPLFRVPLSTVQQVISSLSISLSLAVSQVQSQTTHIILELGPPSDMQLDMRRSLEYILPAVRGLLFNEDVLRTVDKALNALAALDQKAFLGLHLRIEDEREHAPGVKEKTLLNFIKDMRLAGFTNQSLVYVASGIFGYYSKDEILSLESRLRSEGVLGTLLHKGALLDSADLQGLHSEQLALLDLLILTKAQVVVGSGTSSFSHFLRDYRAMLGISKHTFFPQLAYSIHRSFMPDV